MFEDLDPTRLLAEVAERGPGVLSDGDLVHTIRTARAAVAAAEGLALQAMAELRDRRQEEYRRTVERSRGGPVTVADLDGRPADTAEVDRFCAAEVAVALGVSQRAAADQVALADSLRSRLPGTLDALTRGEVGLSQARALTDAAAVLQPDDARALERELIPWARTATPGQVASMARRTAMRLDRTAADARAEAARRARRARAWGLDDGMGALQVTGPAPTVAAAWARVDAIARDAQDQARRCLDDLVAAEAASVTGPSGDGCTDDSAGSGATAGMVPSLDELRADTVLRLLAGTHDITEHPGDAVKVVVDVSVPLATVLDAGGPDAAEPGATEPGEVPGMGPVPPSVAQALAADAEWQAWFSRPATEAGQRPSATGCDGHVPGSYRPSARLARAVRARDRTCRFPGCRAAARRCDVDHTVPHPHGPTAECNLACLCRFHHRLKHRAGWRLEQVGGGVLRWTSPTGLVATTRPPGVDLAPFTALPLAGPSARPPDEGPPDRGLPDDEPPPWASAA